MKLSGLDTKPTFGPLNEEPARSEAVFINAKNKQEVIDRPIRASIIEGNNIDPFSQKMIDQIKKKGVAVDFYGSMAEFRDLNITNQGLGTYVISECDENDKYSEKYYDCTGIIIAGKSSISDQQVSLLSHQNPEIFLGNYRDQFSEDIEDHCRYIRRSVDKNTLDIVIFGGQQDYYNPEEAKIYKQSITFLSTLLKKELGIKPTILTGPKVQDGFTSVYYNTKQRHIYLVRPYNTKNTSVNQSYQLQDYTQKAKKWY